VAAFSQVGRAPESRMSSLAMSEGVPCQKRQSSKGLLPGGKTSENIRGGGSPNPYKPSIGP
jgi:hypothetical protein